MTLLLITHEPALAARCARRLRDGAAAACASRPPRAGAAVAAVVSGLPGCRWPGASPGATCAAAAARFAVLLACLTLGVAIIAAVGILNRGVSRRHSTRDARVLLGGDVELEQANAPIDEDELAALVPPGAQLARIVRTNALATARRALA